MRLKKTKLSRAERVGRFERAVMEGLEGRQLFAASVLQTQGPILAHPNSPATDTIDLSTQFTDTALGQDTIVQFDTTLGDVNVQLTNSQTPNTVTNFLDYISRGEYNDTFFHRSAVLSGSGGGGTPSAPADIVQGGGYTIVDGQAEHVVTGTPVNDEYTNELEGDVRGTLAMAKTSAANSATSEFYFNVHDNSTALDVPTADSNGVTTSYTVFGVVLGDGMTVVDKIAALQTTTVGSLTTVPVINADPTGNPKGRIYSANLIYLNSVKVIPQISFTAVSDNPALVSPVVSGSSLSFKYGTGLVGTANVTVTGTDADGTTVNETFPVTVPNTANPTAAVVTTPDSQTVISGTPATINPLANDTDSVSALDPTSVAIVTQPTNGTASVNSSTGVITYTANTDYFGTDTLTYTVSDKAGNAAPAATTITFDVGIQTTIGIAGHRELLFTQPNGVVGTLSVKDGSAVVTFVGSNVDVSTDGGIVHATGADATIQNITVTNTGSKSASLLMSGHGLATVNAISDTGSMDVIDAPDVQLTGTLNVAGLNELTLNSTKAATLTIGAGLPATNLFIANATDTSVVATTALAIRSRQWLNSDGVPDTITASNITDLLVGGEFDDGLTLSASDVGIAKAKIAGNLNGGAWTVGGSVTNLSAKSAAATWSLTTPQAIGTLIFSGDLAGSVSALSIGSLSVGGNLHDNTISANGVIAGGIALGKLKVAGSITNSSITSNGTIGTVQTGSMTGSQLFAGLAPTVVSGKTLPTDVSNFIEPVAIGDISIHGTFSNSLISAAAMDKLRIGVIQTNNSGNLEGIAGESIGSVTGKLSSGKRIEVGRAPLKSSTTLQNYLTKKQIALGDFTLDVLS